MAKQKPKKETIAEKSEREGRAKIKEMKKKKEEVPIEEQDPSLPELKPGESVEEKGEKEMARFLFTTLQTPLTSYKAPTRRYQIQQNIPFIVTDKEDIKFFDNNHRFQRVTILTKKPDPIQPDQDQLLEAELKKVKGLTKKTIKLLVELYVSKQHLLDVVEQNYELDPSISKAQAKIIKKYIDKESNKQ